MVLRITGITQWYLQPMYSLKTLSWSMTASLFIIDRIVLKASDVAVQDLVLKFLCRRLLGRERLGTSC